MAGASTDKVFVILGSIVMVALVTTLVMPNHYTAGVVKATGKAFADSLSAAMGR